MYAIGICVDEAYVLPCLVTLTSVADVLNAADRRGIAVRVLTQNLRSAHVEVMAEFSRRLGFGSFDLEWRRPAEGSVIVEGDYISTTTYLRFQLTPGFVDRPYLIYLDADVLVLDNISEPLNHLNGNQLGAVRDEFNYTVGECSALPGLVERWPNLHGEPYYNAGALWLRSDVMPLIARGVSRALTHGRRFIRHNDQDALNIWLLSSEAATPLPGKFNRFEMDRFLAESDWVRQVVNRDMRSFDAAILHFVGQMKPWLKSCPATDGVRLYRTYMRAARKLLRKLGDRTVDVNFDGSKDVRV